MLNLTIKEMQIRYHFSPIRLTKIKKFDKAVLAEDWGNK